MKCRPLLLFSGLLGAATVFVRADPTDDAMVAAQKLSTGTGYTWTATVNQNTHPLEIHGKTSATGYSLLTFSSPSAGGGAAAAKSGSNGVNTVFLGDDKYVVESNGSWVAPGNVSAPTASPEPSNLNAGGTAGSSAMRGKRGRGTSGGTGSTTQRRGSGGSEPDSSPATVRPKFPSGVNLPHEELAIVAANHSDLHVEEGGVSGKLTEWGADLLLQPPGWMQAPPDKAAGTFRLWIKDGAVTKYELKLAAESGLGGATIKGGLTETITVEVTDIDNTAVDVPPAAKLKLGI